jgi:hypothetical protein
MIRYSNGELALPQALAWLSVLGVEELTARQLLKVADGWKAGATPIGPSK